MPHTTAQDPAATTDVDIGTPERLADWARQLGTTPDALAAAVKAVGRRIDRIKDHLTGGSAGGQADG